jgi:hypothetical protein
VAKGYLDAQGVSLVPLRDVPPAVAEMVEMVLERQLKVYAAIAALAPLQEPHPTQLTAAPALTGQKWSKLAEMMADGRLPLMHSFPELTRALLKLCEDET